jgi:hypothetical protein
VVFSLRVTPGPPVQPTKVVWTGVPSVYRCIGNSPELIRLGQSFLQRKNSGKPVLPAERTEFTVTGRNIRGEVTTVIVLAVAGFWQNFHPRDWSRAMVQIWLMMILLLLFLQKQSLAFAVYIYACM